MHTRFFSAGSQLCETLQVIYYPEDMHVLQSCVHYIVSCTKEPDGGAVCQGRDFFWPEWSRQQAIATSDL